MSSLSSSKTVLLHTDLRHN